MCQIVFKVLKGVLFCYLNSFILKIFILYKMLVWMITLALFSSCCAESYTVVGVSIGPVATFIRDFKPTFEFYLSEQVSRALARNISFRLIGVSLNAEKDTIFDLVESKSVDFVYSAPNMLGCLESEFDIQLLATMRKKYIVDGQEYILNRQEQFDATTLTRLIGLCWLQIWRCHPSKVRTCDFPAPKRTVGISESSEKGELQGRQQRSEFCFRPQGQDCGRS
jgi:hypothetical protein